MVDNFGARLIQTIEAAGYATGATAVTREFNMRSGAAPITVHGVRKWLQGESLPSQDRLVILAKWLNVEPQWLRFGQGTMIAKGDKDSRSLSHADRVMLQDYRALSPEHQAMVRGFVAILSKKLEAR